MYKIPKEHQLSFTDFNQSCRLTLDPNNEWCLLAGSIDWAGAEKIYAEKFPSSKGHPAMPLRMLLEL